MNPLSIRLGNYRIGLRIHTSPHKFSGQFMFAHVADTFGITNRFKNTKLQSLFMDIDNKSIQEIEQWLSYIDDDNYCIGDSYLFESSSNHYHIINPTLLTSRDILNILDESQLSKMVDARYAKHYFLYGDNTIRMWPKYTEKGIERQIKFVKIIESNDNIRLKHKGLTLAIFQQSQEIAKQYNLGKLLPLLDNSSLKDLICKRYETVNW